MDSPLRILLVEDSMDDAEMIVRALKREMPSMSCERVERWDSVTQALARGNWDVVVCDYSLPLFSGLDVLSLLRKGEADLPFILVSGMIGEEKAVEAMKAGANDYVMKEHLVRLGPAIRREIREAAGRRERRRAEERLKESLLEKETLLKEIHHRVKNNLQIVYSLINLQARRVQDPKTLEGLHDCRDRVRTMALVHEKLYESADLARIDFAEYLRDLTKNLLQSSGSGARPARLTVEADAVFLGIDEAVPCGLIVYELVSNSMKHAFPDGRGGEIRVGLHRGREGLLSLEVRDDGVGFPPEVDFRETSSLGLRLVCTLVGQLGGTIELGEGPGARFILSLPAPAHEKKEVLS